MKKNLGLVRCQIDIDRGRWNCNFKHEDGIAVSGLVVRILSSVVLTQQLMMNHTIQPACRQTGNKRMLLDTNKVIVV